MSNYGIILAAGSGSRMNSDIKKQFMTLKGRPLVCHSLQTMQDSNIITDIIVVTGADDLDYMRNDIIGSGNYGKVRAVVAGGAERYHSVMNGLEAVQKLRQDRLKNDRTPDRAEDYVFIHDGARPRLTEDIIVRTYEAVREVKAVTAAVKTKDTVKIAGPDNFVESTPDRRFVWNIQTPQVFEADLIYEAYSKLMDACNRDESVQVTDDAMTVEMFTGRRVRLVEGSYENIKVTTPVDITFLESLE